MVAVVSAFDIDEQAPGAFGADAVLARDGIARADLGLK
jgi:hypothetical protein